MNKPKVPTQRVRSIATRLVGLAGRKNQREVSFGGRRAPLLSPSISVAPESPRKGEPALTTTAAVDRLLHLNAPDLLMLLCGRAIIMETCLLSVGHHLARLI